jgi:hypothetical protein
MRRPQQADGNKPKSKQASFLGYMRLPEFQHGFAERLANKPPDYDTGLRWVYEHGRQFANWLLAEGIAIPQLSSKRAAILLQEAIFIGGVCVN